MGKSLLIVGNGFDLSHGMNTRYEDFRKFLLTDKAKINNKFFEQIKIGDGSISVKDLLCKTIDISLPSFCSECTIFHCRYHNDSDSIVNWGNFEENLQYIDFEFALDVLSRSKINFVDQNFEGSKEDIRISLLHKLFSEIPYLMRQWINETIDYAKIKEEIFSCVDKKYRYENWRQLLKGIDCVLTFNYTDILENLYSMSSDKIVHIHGRASDENSQIIVGHSNYELIDEGITGEDDETSQLLYNAAYIHNKLTVNFAKPTRKIIERFQNSFFDKVDQFDNVYCMGFSYAKADIPYVEKICQKFDKQVIWHEYNRECVAEQFSKLKACGFNGKYMPFWFD